MTFLLFFSLVFLPHVPVNLNCLLYFIVWREKNTSAASSFSTFRRLTRKFRRWHSGLLLLTNWLKLASLAKLFAYHYLKDEISRYILFISAGYYATNIIASLSTLTCFLDMIFCRGMGEVQTQVPPEQLYKSKKTSKKWKCTQKWQKIKLAT